MGAFAPVQNKAPTSTALNAVGLYYSTSTGNTETAAGYIAEAFSVEAEDIGDAEDAAISGASSLVIGAPTWHTGADEQRSEPAGMTGSTIPSPTSILTESR